MREKKRVTLIPYGFLTMVGLCFISDFFEDESIGFKIISILVFISLVVMIIHAIRIISKCLEYSKWISWENNYIKSNPIHSKTKDELKLMFYDEIERKKNLEYDEFKRQRELNKIKKKEEKEQKKKEFERIMSSSPEVTIKANNNTNLKLQKEEEKLKRQADVERLRNAGRTVPPSEQRSYKSDNDSKVASCPKCRSTSITANKKGFSAVKGVLGLAVSPLAGAIAGGAGRNKVMCTCLKCGYQWKAGKK